MFAPEKKSTKRGGHARVQLGRDKKRQHAELQARNKGEAKQKQELESVDIDLSDMEPESLDGSEAEDGDADEFVDVFEGSGYGADVLVEKKEDVKAADFINWQFNTPPYQLNKAFTGAAGPKHTLSPEQAVPIDYFNLFIPMFFGSDLQPTQTPKLK